MASLPLTTSQDRALRQLGALAALYFSRQTVAGIIPRTNTLLVGPSGVGKTFLVSRLAATLKVPILKLTVGDWIVTGARTEPCTMELVRSRLRPGNRLILHLDELDKLRDHANAWSLSVMAEVFNLLDRRVNYSGTAAKPWTEQHDQALHDNVFIVGTGTWQELWPRSSNRPIGFFPHVPTPLAAVPPDTVFRAIRDARTIPEELLNRFCAEWLVLEPYSTADFARLATALKLDPAVLDPVVAEASGLNFRYLESAITKAALSRRLLERGEHREKPTGPLNLPAPE